MGTIIRPGVIARFYECALRGNLENDCWIWIGPIQKDNGYGRFVVNYDRYYAHVISYMIYHNLQRMDFHILHTCDNHRCVNPKHLFLGTQQDNNEDRDAKGRQAKGEDVGSAKLTTEEVLEIKRRYRTENITQTELAEDYNVLPNTISRIINGKRWKHLHLPV